MNITCVDQRDSKFGATSIDDAIERCEAYAEPGDVFRVYIYGRDIDEPYPGFVAVELSCDESGTTATKHCCRVTKYTKHPYCMWCGALL